MPPVVLVMLLVAALLALLPVWRLHAAGWPRRWLVLAWGLYAGAILVSLRAPAAARILLPILVLAFVAPFVAGPERLARVMRGPAEAPRPIINVTPRPPTGLPPGRHDEAADDADDAVEDAVEDAVADASDGDPGRPHP